MKKAAAGVVLAATVLVMAGCSAGPEYSSKGTVVSKEEEYECDKVAALSKSTVRVTRAGSSTAPKPAKPKDTKKAPKKKGSCGWEWEVDVKTSGGITVEEDVTQDHYGRCDVGEKFPDCTKG
jgi:hypothetical protein